MKHFLLIICLATNSLWARPQVKSIPFPMEQYVLEEIASYGHYKDAFRVKFTLGEKLGSYDLAIEMRDTSPKLTQFMVALMLNRKGTGDFWASLEPSTRFQLDAHNESIYTLTSRGSSTLKSWISFWMRTSERNNGWEHDLVLTTVVRYKNCIGTLKWFPWGIGGHRLIAPANLRRMIRALEKKHPLTSPQ